MTLNHIWRLYVAVVAFLLLSASLVIGIKCFLDFDKGLYESKAHGQSYTPVKMQVIDVFKMGD
jgi:hypothetical protein